MKKGEAESMMPHLVEKWVTQTNEPWPPDWRIIAARYVLVVAAKQPSPLHAISGCAGCRYVSEVWFDKIARQTWRN